MRNVARIISWMRKLRRNQDERADELGLRPNQCSSHCPASPAPARPDLYLWALTLVPAVPAGYGQQGGPGCLTKTHSQALQPKVAYTLLFPHFSARPKVLSHLLPVT